MHTQRHEQSVIVAEEERTAPKHDRSIAQRDCGPRHRTAAKHDRSIAQRDCGGSVAHCNAPQRTVA